MFKLNIRFVLFSNLITSLGEDVGRFCIVLVCVVVVVVCECLFLTDRRAINCLVSYFVTSFLFNLTVSFALLTV